MLSFSGSLRVFVALETCDMRKGFNGLEALIVDRLKECVRDGALFLSQTKAQPPEIPLLGWFGTVGVVQTPGKRPV